MSASHEPASNSLINAEGKTEREITILSKEYTELAEKLQEEAEQKAEIENLVEKINKDESGK